MWLPCGFLELIFVGVVIRTKIELGEVGVVGDVLGQGVRQKAVALNGHHLFDLGAFVQLALASFLSHGFQFGVLFRHLPLLAWTGRGVPVLSQGRQAALRIERVSFSDRRR